MESTLSLFSLQSHCQRSHVNISRWMERSQDQVGHRNWKMAKSRSVWTFPDSHKKKQKWIPRKKICLNFLSPKNVLSPQKGSLWRCSYTCWTFTSLCLMLHCHCLHAHLSPDCTFSRDQILCLFLLGGPTKAHILFFLYTKRHLGNVGCNYYKV